MRFVLVGGSGYLGTLLSERFTADGHQVVNISRSGQGTRTAQGFTYGHLQPQCEGAAAVINLAGSNLGRGRWTAERRHEHITSRVESTKLVVNAISQCTVKPALINVSGSHYYGNTLVPTNEAMGHGQSFLANLCVQWEAEAMKANAFTRVAIMRVGMILDSNYGALPAMAKTMRLFLGGPMGKGTQFIPWIHKTDAVEAFMWAATSDAFGPYNIAAPQSVTFKEFSATLGRVLHRPSWFRIPELPLRMMIGRMAELMVEGQNLVPMRLNNPHFSFRYPALQDALTNLLGS